MKHWYLMGVMALALTACQSTASKQQADFANLAVSDFDAKRYMGHWYEVGRFDFTWEKDLKNVTAQYRLKDDGGIQVINQGVNINTEKAKSTEGKARFNGSERRGALEVSFFGPFYSQYNVVKIDPQYRYALVFGKNTDYVWLLSRDKTMPETVKQDYVRYAQQQGYDVSKMVWTQQD